MSQQYLLQNYHRLALRVASGEGCYVCDESGRRYLDMISGIGVNAFGYCHPRITRVLVEQAQRCVHTSNLVSHRHQEALAKRLCRASGLDRAFFSNSGTEAMEAALKAVRSRAGTVPVRLVALERSFHGRTMGSLAVTGQPALRQRFGGSGAEVVFVEPNDRTGLEAAIGPETAAVVLEPVLGEGGIYPLGDGFLQAARDLTRRAGALLVADEVQCGLGRTGRYFAYQGAGILPDIAITAKPLAAGLPLGATLFTEEAAQWLPPHSHGTTFGGGALACRVALEFLDMMEERLPEIDAVAGAFLERLEGLRRRHETIREIRSKGLMFGIQLTVAAHPVVEAALERGLWINAPQETVIRMLPAYIVGEAEMDEAVRILDEALGAVGAVRQGEGADRRVPRLVPAMRGE
jgi:acetylornithine/succinyldiaminopimelate/putrescine aminotransferase